MESNQSTGHPASSAARGLYIHIPFCLQKCPYCDFSSFDNIPFMADNYIEAVLRELRYYKDHYDIAFNTLFIGGGTPTVLTEKQLDYLFSGVFSMVDRKKLKEITIEANPETVTERKAKVLEVNVNRVSLGCQTFHEAHLKKLSRIHDSSAIYAAFALLRKYNIKNINLDLMFGLEGQSTLDVLDSIKKAAELDPEHISFYMLTVYSHTEFGRQKESGNLVLPADDVLENMYFKGAAALEAAGYSQYEISNFSKPGRECLHNLNYWLPGEYVGLGASASSCFDGSRYKNIDDVFEYIKRLKAGDDPAESSEKVTPENSLKDHIMLRLRLAKGIDAQAFKDQFGFDFQSKYSNIITRFTEHGLAVSDSAGFRLTKKGFLLSNEIIKEFFLR